MLAFYTFLLLIAAICIVFFMSIAVYLGDKLQKVKVQDLILYEKLRKINKETQLYELESIIAELKFRWE